MSDEFERLVELRRRLGERAAPVSVDIGDDASVLTPDPRAQVWTVDAAVDGVHFRPDLLSFEDIGYRSVTAAVSDLAAMGATPRACLVALALPRSFSDESLWMLVEGIREAAGSSGAPVIGGNLSGAGELSITTTALGALDAAPLTRDGAKVGDGVFVTGTLGGAALGLAELEAHSNQDSPFTLKWKRPTARLEEGRQLASAANAAIDVSDGLHQDLCHLCQASGVGARVHAARLPRHASFDAAAEAVDADPIALLLAGGEDYELLFTTAAQAPSWATRIGEIVEGNEVVVLDAQGTPLSVPDGGYRHFRSGHVRL